jgi:hypothetical protein
MTFSGITFIRYAQCQTIGKSNNSKVSGSKKIKGPKKQESQNQLRIPRDKLEIHHYLIQQTIFFKQSAWSKQLTVTLFQALIFNKAQSNFEYP